MKIFIAGSMTISYLDCYVIEKLNNIIRNENEIIIGNAKGIDRLVVNFLKIKNYNFYKIYQPNKLEKYKKADFYKIDKNMSEIANVGFMIWDGKSAGTLNNIKNLLRLNKKVCVFIQPERKFYYLKNIEQLGNIYKKQPQLPMSL